MWSIIHLSDGDDYGLYRVGSRNPEGGMILSRGTLREVVRWRRNHVHLPYA